MSDQTAILEHGSDAEKLCDLLLELVGRGPGRMASARRHAHVLDAAMAYMNTEQRAEGRRRITALETRWGSLLPGGQNEAEIDGLPPQVRVAHWLSKRKVPERHLQVLHRAAVKVAEDETCLSDIADHMFAIATTHVFIPVKLDSLKEWLIELRIARQVAKGVYVPGSLCSWWITEMAPSKDKGSMYQRCLELFDVVRSKRA